MFSDPPSTLFNLFHVLERWLTWCPRPASRCIWIMWSTTRSLKGVKRVVQPVTPPRLSSQCYLRLAASPVCQPKVLAPVWKDFLCSFIQVPVMAPSPPPQAQAQYYPLWFPYALPVSLWMVLIFKLFSRYSNWINSFLELVPSRYHHYIHSQLVKRTYVNIIR